MTLYILFVLKYLCYGLRERSRRCEQSSGRTSRLYRDGPGIVGHRARSSLKVCPHHVANSRVKQEVVLKQAQYFEMLFITFIFAMFNVHIGGRCPPIAGIYYARKFRFRTPVPSG